MWHSADAEQSSDRSGASRFGSIASLGGGGGGGGPHSDDDDDEEENQERESWFAGGERRYQRVTSLLRFELIRYSLYSGLSIENPDRQRAVPGGNMVRDLLRRAAQ